MKTLHWQKPSTSLSCSEISRQWNMKGCKSRYIMSIQMMMCEKQDIWNSWKITFRKTQSNDLGICVFVPEMSIGLDLDRTGSGLWRILFNLDWIQTVQCLINLGSGPDLDWLNRKICVIFVIEKLLYWTLFGLGFS